MTTSITMSDITSSTLNGTGSFDKLMQVVKMHLQEEFTAQRIRGTDYANVYIASIGASLQQSMQFELTRETSAAQADLARSQADRAIIELETAEKNNALIDAQIAKIQADILLTQQQRENMLIEKDRMVIEVQLTNQKLLNSQLEYTMLEKQLIRADREIDLMTQKVITEKAQTSDLVDGETIGGVIGKQKVLFDRQASGFLRDAEQKAASIFGNFWNISKSADPTGVRESEILGEVEYIGRTAEDGITPIIDELTGLQEYVPKLVDQSEGGFSRLNEVLATLKRNAVTPPANGE